MVTGAPFTPELLKELLSTSGGGRVGNLTTVVHTVRMRAAVRKRKVPAQTNTGVSTDVMGQLQGRKRDALPPERRWRGRASPLSGSGCSLTHGEARTHETGRRCRDTHGW